MTINFISLKQIISLSTITGVLYSITCFVMQKLTELAQLRLMNVDLGDTITPMPKV